MSVKKKKKKMWQILLLPDWPSSQCPESWRSPSWQCQFVLGTRKECAYPVCYIEQSPLLLLSVPSFRLCPPCFPPPGACILTQRWFLDAQYRHLHLTMVPSKVPPTKPMMSSPEDNCQHGGVLDLKASLIYHYVPCGGNHMVLPVVPVPLSDISFEGLLSTPHFFLCHT